MAGPRTIVRGCATAIVLMGLVPLLVADPAHAATKARFWDFDGDGYADLATGVPGENSGAGSVVTLRGTASGIATSGGKAFSQDTAGIPGTAELGDAFGFALASGDFDGDGHADLAVTAISEDSASEADIGSVTIIYGTASGLSASRSTTLGRPLLFSGDSDPSDDFLGAVLLAANVDGDGDDDLVVTTQAGADGILVYKGSSAGLATTPSQAIGPGVGLPARSGAFGSDLAVGDVDGNGVSDVVVGWSAADGGSGAVVVLYGAKGFGLDVDGSHVRDPQVWSGASAGVKGTQGASDLFGAQVGVGDVTGDGRKDVIVSAPGEAIASGFAGALHVLPGSSSGVTASGDQYLTHESLVDTPEGFLGIRLGTGDLNADGVADVAVTTGFGPGVQSFGRVIVLYGSVDGSLGSRGLSSFTQATPGVGGVVASGSDYWGFALSVRDVGKSGTADLIVGDYFEDSPGSASGMVDVLWGSASKPTGTGSTTLTQDTAGVPGSSEANDNFGQAL